MRFGLLILALMGIVSVQAQKTYTNPVYASDFPDPSVQRGEDGLFYSYATGPRCRKSKDLVTWESVNSVISRPTWNDTTYVNAEGNKVTDYYSFWACDVSQIDDKYIMYYACALWGNGTRTGIGVATGNTLTKFTDKGKLFRSTEIGVHNSIDPVYIEEKDKKYLAWGSFHDIYIAELTDDGLKIKDFNKKTKIAGGAFEGAMFHKRGNYYYLICSVGSCCEGVNSTYKTVVGRATSLTGPYKNKQGGSMFDNNYTTIIKGNTRWKGTGHNSEIVTDDNGNDWLLYHAYDANNPDKGRMMLLDKITWSSDGWPSINDGTPTTTAQPAPVFYTGDGANKSFRFKNLDFAKSNFKFWTAKTSEDCTAKSGAGSVFCPLVSVKNGGEFDIYQTKSDLPNGLYEIKMNAFDTHYNAAVYVNSVETLVHNETQSNTLPTNDNTISLQFLRDNYVRKAYGLVTNGTLRIGMRSVNPFESSERFYLGGMQVIYREKNATALASVLNSYYAMADSVNKKDKVFYAGYRSALQQYRITAEESKDNEVRYNQLLSIHHTLDSIDGSIILYDSLQNQIEWMEEQNNRGEAGGFSNETVKNTLNEAKTAWNNMSYTDAQVKDLITRMQECVHDMNYSYEKGDGTIDNPYIISRPEQLMNMHNVMVAEKMLYFAMEADVDMAGFEWEQLNTSANKYRHWINFDGRGHIIRNLKPADQSGYPSFFGILCGECRNVGFVDAEVTSTASGAGILCGYMGHSTFKDSEGNQLPVVVENCYFTGKITSKGYVGVLGGTLNNSPITIKNVYSVVDIIGNGMSGNYCGGIVGRVRTGLTIENCYSAGDIEAPIAAPIAAGGQNASTPGTIFTNVIAWNKDIKGTKEESTVVPFAVTAEADILTNTYVFADMKINGENIEEGKTHTELQDIAKTWGTPWHSDPTAGNGYPILQWQYERGDYKEICGFELTDGIESIPSAGNKLTENQIYDLSGRKVNKPGRGLYIVNGKKVIY